VKSIFSWQAAAAVLLAGAGDGIEVFCLQTFKAADFNKAWNRSQEAVITLSRVGNLIFSLCSLLQVMLHKCSLKTRSYCL